MHIQHATASIMLLVLVSLSQAVAAASTVTLTGTCPGRTINQSSNYLLFNITNSGNGAATDLILSPRLEGATTPNSTAVIPMVSPGGSYTVKFYLYNFTLPGSYVEYINATYSQGASTFVTIFPCLVGIDNNAQSVLQILSMNSTSSKLGFTILNPAGYPIQANVTVRAPSGFGVEPAEVPVLLNPQDRATVRSNVSAPKYTDASFPIVVAVSYVKDGMHYASLGVVPFSFASASASSSAFTSLTTMVVIAAMAIILLLIALSVLERRRREPSPTPPPQVNA